MSNTVDIAYKLDLRQLRADLARVSGLTAGEVRVMLAEVQKSNRQIQREAAATAAAAAAEAKAAAAAQVSAQEQAAASLARLQRAQMSGSQRAIADLTAEVQALEELQKAGADAATVARARALAVEQGSARIAAALAKEQALTDGGAGPGLSPGGAPADAQKLAAGMERSAAATWQMNNAASSLRRNIGDVANSLIAGQAPITVLLQQGPQLAEVFATSGNAAGLLKSAMSGVTAALSAVAVPLAAVTIAVGAAAALYSTYANRSEELAEASGRVAQRLADTAAGFDRAKAAAQEAQAAWAGFRGSAGDLESELQVALGQTTQAAVDFARTRRRLEEEAREGIATTARLATEAEAARDAAYTAAQKARADGDKAEAAALERQVHELNKAAIIARDDLATKRQALDAAIETADSLRLIAEASEAATKREEARARATASAAERARAAAAALKEEQERANSLRRAEAAAMQAQEAQARALAEVEVQALQARAERTGELADLEAAVAAAQVQRQQDLAAAADRALAAGVDAADVERAYLTAAQEAELQGQAQIEAARELAHQDELRRIEERRDQSMSAARRTADTLIQMAATVAATELATRTARAQELRQILTDNEEALTEAQKRRLTAALAAENEAARKAFRAQQTAQISAATMAASVAVMQGYAQLGPVGGSIFAGAAAGLLAAQVAQIARQQPPVYDLGGMVPLPTQRSRHTTATLEAGEAVLTRQGVDAVGGPEGVAAANEGRGGSGAGPVSVALTLRHRVLDALLVEHAGRGGTGRVTRPSRLNPYLGVAR